MHNHFLYKNAIKATIAILYFMLMTRTEAYAQERINTLELELSTVLGTAGEVPFWLHAQRNGIIDREGNNGYARVSAQSFLGKLGEISFSAEADFYSRLSVNSSAFFNQGYIQADWKGFELYAGRKIDPLGIQDTSLSTGSMMQSRNAVPIPKIAVSTSGFLDVPGTGGWLGFKGYLAHGWFEADRIAENAYLHQKNIYLRFFRSENRFNAYAGFLHNVTWGGNHLRYGELPQSFRDYIRVFLGKNIAEDSGYPGPEPGGTLGNTTAGYDTGITYDFGEYHILAHRFFYLEDRPGLWFRNVWDGQWTVSLKRSESNALVTGVSWQHVRALRQGAQPHEQRGADNYYNNSLYLSGWTYHQRTIGSPFLFSDGSTPGVVNNILVMHNIGLEGRVFNRLDYRLFLTYSRNYGAKRIFTDPEATNSTSGRTGRRDQYSGILDTVYQLNSRFSLHLSVAFDHGELYKNQLGIQAGFIGSLK